MGTGGEKRVSGKQQAIQGSTCRSAPGTAYARLPLSFRMLAPVMGILALMNLASAPARAATASPWATTEQSAVRLLAASLAVGSGDTVTLGLQFRLQPGWKVYWRTPGDAGVAPRFIWDESQNLARATVSWPAPHRFNLYGLESFGYLREVVLPVTITLRQPGHGLAVRLALNYGICREICIPYQAELALDLPAGAAASSDFAPLIADYAAKVPKTAADGDLSMGQATVAAAEGGGATLRVTARATTPFIAPDLIVEGPDGIGFGKPQAEISADGRQVRLVAPIEGLGGPGTPAALAGKPVTLTLIDGDRAVEQRLTITSSGAATAARP